MPSSTPTASAQVTPTPPPLEPQKPQTALIIGILIAVLAVAGGGYWAYFQVKSSEESEQLASDDRRSDDEEGADRNDDENEEDGDREDDRSSDDSAPEQPTGNIFSYITPNTEGTSFAEADESNTTYLYRAMIDAPAEEICAEFQDSGYVGAGADVDYLLTDEGMDRFDAAAGASALDAYPALGPILSDGSTLAEVCVWNDVLFVTTVGPDGQTVTPYEYSVFDAAFYAFDPILTVDAFHQLHFKLIPGYIILSTATSYDTGEGWEVYVLDSGARSADLLERCSRTYGDDGSTSMVCNREWTFGE